jgi:hypothetical protein
MTGLKRIYLLIFFTCIAILFFTRINAQETLLHVKGEVVGEAEKPLASATIALLDKNDKDAVKATADSNGYFTISHKIKGRYTLLISHSGYKIYKSTPFELANNNFGKIRLAISSSDLEAVVVESKQNLVEVDGGTIVFNVAKSINAQGTNALEVLKRAPGIFVENEAAIALNGRQGALILLDGKQTYLSGKELIDLLRSMPSSSIKSIEIINSPSAKYDAAGSAGIINIKTNKISVKGFSGSTTVGFSIGITPKQNADVSFNYRRAKFSIYGSYNHFIGFYNYLYGSDRTQNGKVYNSLTDDVDKRKKMGTRLGVDYSIDKNSTLGILLNGNFVFGGGITRTGTDIGQASSTDFEQKLTAVNDYYYQQTERYNINFNYKYENAKGTIINLDADYGFFKKGNKNLQSNIYTDDQQAILSQNLYRSFNGIDINLKAFKADYTTAVWKGTLETGAKYSSISSDNSARFFHVLQSTDSLDDRRSNTFDFSEQIVSSYLSFKKSVGKWTFQGGVRLEKTSSTGSLFFKAGVNDSTQNIKRDYTDLFPSISVSLKADANHNFSLSYSKRIDRPAYHDLNPFIYLLDELSFWQGNPFLRPQYSNRFLLQYLYKNSTILGIGYIHTNGYSARITDTIEAIKIVMIPRNLGIQKNISFSLTQNLTLTKWWELTFNGTVYRLHNTIAFDQFRNLELKQMAGRMSLQQRFKMPYSLTGEISGYFNTRRLSNANEISRAVSQVDIGLQKAFLKGKATLRIAVSDIYKGGRFRSVQDYEGFYLNNFGYYESRLLKINFTHKFAESSVKGPRNRNSALENENSRIK